MKRKLISELLLPAAILLATPAIALEDDYVKEYRRSVKVNANAVLDLDVNFASMKITTWDSPQIDIYVKIDANAKSQLRADAIFGKIDVAIGESASKVDFRITTGNLHCGSNENFTIDVEVKMPAGGALHGTAAFGDVELTSLSGSSNFSVEYGAFNAGGLTAAANNFRIAFGDAEIGNFGGGNLASEYGSLHVLNLSGDAVVKSAFGDLAIDHVQPACKNLDVDVEYGSAEIMLGSTASFNVEADCSYGDIKMPEGFKKTRSQTDYTSKQLEGTIGNAASGKLNINCDFSDVELAIK